MLKEEIDKIWIMFDLSVYFYIVLVFNCGKIFNGFLGFF